MNKTQVNIEEAEKIYLLNNAGEENIKLIQNSKGNFRMEISHDCRDLEEGGNYLIKVFPKMKELHDLYNTLVTPEKTDKKKEKDS